jgi:hypothetical protein
MKRKQREERRDFLVSLLRRRRRAKKMINWRMQTASSSSLSSPRSTEDIGFVDDES